MNLLLHVSQVERWIVAVGNTKNYLKEEKTSRVEIVLNSEAVSLFKQPTQDFLEDLIELYYLGVEILVCRNSLMSLNITESTLPKEVTVVPAGIFEIVAKQADGFAYVKP